MKYRGWGSSWSRKLNLSHQGGLPGEVTLKQSLKESIVSESYVKGGGGVGVIFEEIAYLQILRQRGVWRTYMPCCGA